MLTVFSSNFSDKHTSGDLSTSVLVGSSSSTYYGYFVHHDALTNASVHVTSAALSTSATTCRNLNVYRVKCSGCYNVRFGYDKQKRFPYTGSVLLYVMKYSEGQKTDYNNQIVDLKTLPLYTDPGDVVFHRHYFDDSRVKTSCSVDFDFGFKTNITIKPNQRLRFCLFVFAGHRPNIYGTNLELTTTVFYNGN